MHQNCIRQLYSLIQAIHSAQWLLFGWITGRNITTLKAANLNRNSVFLFQRADIRSLGDGGKPVIVFIKDQRDSDGYFYGGHDSEGDDEDEGQRGRPEEKTIEGHQAIFFRSIDATAKATTMSPPNGSRNASEFFRLVKSEKRFLGLRRQVATGLRKRPFGYQN